MTTFEINETNQVVPYISGRKCHETAAFRDATDLEIAQREEIERLERERDEARKVAEELKEWQDEHLKQYGLGLLFAEQLPWQV